MAKLLESTRQRAKNWATSMQSYIDQAVKAEEIVMLLPEEIREIRGDADTNYSGDLQLSIPESLNDGTSEKDEPARDIPALLSSIGIILEQPVMDIYGRWTRNGNGTLMSGHEVEVTYQLKDKPDNCELIEVRTRPLVIRYKSKCEETG